MLWGSRPAISIRDYRFAHILHSSVAFNKLTGIAFTTCPAVPVFHFDRS